MSEVEQLEQLIENLSPDNLAKFRAWFVEFDARVWDAQIEADAKAGKLDGRITEALADYEIWKGSRVLRRVGLNRSSAR